MKFKSQFEQQRLQLQREHSSEMEQILEKVSVHEGPYCSRLTSHWWKSVKVVVVVIAQFLLTPWLS